jgi:hypothetical protein
VAGEVMRYTFLSAHCVQGIAHPVGEPDLVLFEDQDRGIRALLTADAVPKLSLLNRHSALLFLMLRGMIGDPLTADFPEALARETEKVERQRRDSIGSDPVVIVEIGGRINAEIPSNARAIQDFVVCFDAFDKKALKARAQSEVSAVLTALRFGTGEPLEFRQLVDGSCLFTNDGKVVHSASIEAGNVGMYVSRRLSAAQKGQVARDISLALNAGSLERVMRLQAHSLNKATDNYRAFVSAWSALEILIGKLFPIYQSLLDAELHAANQSPGLRMYLDRVTAVMGDKHNLADKFAVLSIYLDDDGGEKDVGVFKGLKRFRDRLSHGEDIEEGELPTKDVQRLFDKYLRSHLRRPA